MKRITLLIYLTTFALASAFAIPAKPGIAKHIQSDGTVVTFEVIGDEYNHHTLVNGLYTAMRDASGDFCYALAENGVLVNSGVKIRDNQRLTAQEKKIAQQSIGARRTAFNPYFNSYQHSQEAAMMRVAEQMKAAASAPNNEALRIGDWGGAVSGARNFIVIMVQYTDKGFSITNPREKFSDMLNTENYSTNNATGSAKDYFVASSSKTFVPTFDVVGPYTLSQKREYYGGNDARGDDKNPAVQAVEACQLADSEVDFSQYDYDGDGDIDLVFILYAGHNPAEWGPEEAVWPHQWTIMPGYNIDGNEFPMFDGKKLLEYACTSELRGYQGTNMTNIGTFCHEFGHALGLPDWYDTLNSGTNACFGMDYASIMNSGSYLNNSATPPTHNALERWMLGWTLPKEINATGSYEMQHVSKNDTYIMWANPSKTECFLFEARTKNANFKWDYYLNNGDPERGLQGGDGMLVYHVDWSTSYYSKWTKHQINTDPSHQCAYLYRANPNATSSSSSGWFFPGARNITELSYDGTPMFKNWAGVRMPLELKNISVSGSNILFDVVSKDFEVSTLQYDALLDWTKSTEVAAKWIVKCIDKESGEENTLTTTRKYILLTPLKSSSRYHAQVYKDGDEEPLYEAEILTQSNGITPRPSLMLSSTYTSHDLIRLSVKNLDGDPSNIEWYVDRQKVEELVFTLPAGQHHICAVITDQNGNTSYLYRYITVK